MSDKSATRWGIASAGLISQDFTNAISCLPKDQHKVVAVAARTQAAAETFRQKFGLARAYEGYEGLAGDSEVEVVYIGAIHPAHLGIAKLMLEAGKHVICEKPLCMNVKETLELVELARKKKLFLMEAVWSRCLPAYEALRQELSADTVGDVLQVIVSFGMIIDVPRLHQKDLGGGTVLDLGIYCVQLASLVFGGERPEKVVAGGHLGPDGVDESTSATLVYQGGRTATLLTHTKVKLPCEGLIVGTKGSLKLPFPVWCSTALETPTGVKEFPLPTGARHKFNFLQSENMAHEASHVRDCLLAGKTESPLISLDETIVMAEIMESIRKQVGVVYPQD